MFMTAGQKKRKKSFQEKKEGKDQDWARTRKWNYTCKRTETKAKQDERGWKAASEI